ncbi:MAG TPA: hypothetical protein VJV79_05160 [Polyangiaceae bacterium]|nr:hypothetical protein [Polyangiaceae bacterium]
MPRSLLNLSPRLRPVFFCVYLATQLFLLFRAQKSPDLVFGFQMFNASSQLKISLFRKVKHRGRSRVVPIRDGSWETKDRSGIRHTHRWHDRIRYPNLTHLDLFVHASYGLDAQLFRLQAALRDFALQLSNDEETEALIAEVDTLKNGREAGHVRLQADRR